MADCDVTFTHEPLDNTRQQIRLISIAPEPSGEIKCQLKNAYLDDDTTPDYRAVSYVWGPPTPLKRISINGRPLEVRLNLYAFFEAFRARLFKFRSNGTFEDETQWLWVDQVCINQTLVNERNHQVKIMSDIYSQATYVYVWLGPSHADIEVAMGAMKSGLRRYYEDRTARPPTRKRKQRQVAESNQECNSGNKAYIQPAPPLMHALKCFFENPYWQRLWIVQEIMLARYIRIICGDTLLSWDELRRFCMSSIQQFPPQLQDSVPRQMIWLTEHALSAKTYAFSNLLVTFSTSQCQNPKDKVYGLQGLLAPDARIKIDYAQSTEAVFQDAARLMLKDMRPVAPERFGKGLEQLDYTKPTETVFLEAFLVANAQAESIIGLPQAIPLIELGTAMGLDSQQLYEAWIKKSDFEQIRSQWNDIIHYYMKERLHALYGREYIEIDPKKVLWWDPTLMTLVSNLCDQYNELAFFLKHLFQDIWRPQGRWRSVNRDDEVEKWWSDKPRNRWLTKTFDGPLTKGYQEDLMAALEKIAFMVIAKG